MLFTQVRNAAPMRCVYEIRHCLCARRGVLVINAPNMERTYPHMPPSHTRSSNRNLAFKRFVFVAVAAQKQKIAHAIMQAQKGVKNVWPLRDDRGCLLSADGFLNCIRFYDYLYIFRWGLNSSKRARTQMYSHINVNARTDSVRHYLILIIFSVCVCGFANMQE